jgi:hypothetical protein
MKKAEKSRRPVRVSDAKSAKRLLSRILLQLQKQKFDVGVARCMVNALEAYVKMLSGAEVEERLNRIEKGLGIGAESPHDATDAAPLSLLGRPLANGE